MDNRPEFWDFFRAMRGSKNEDWYLEVRNKETGKVTVYYKTDRMRNPSAAGISRAIPLILSISILFLNYSIDLWRYLQVDLLFIGLGIGYLINLLITRHTYYNTVFEEVPEEERNDSGQIRRKPHWIVKLIGRFIFLAVVLSSFLFSYTYTYFRYLVEGGASQASVVVSFNISEDTEITLDGSTRDGAVFDGRESKKNDVFMEITLKKIPGKAAVYVNGKRIEMSHINRKFHFFREDEYFESSAYVFADLNGPGEVNTLEIKTSSFDKVWTFILKGEREAAT